MVFLKVDERFKKLVVRLQYYEHLSYKEMVKHVGICSQSLLKIYKRSKEVN